MLTPGALNAARSDRLAEPKENSTGPYGEVMNRFLNSACSAPPLSSRNPKVPDDSADSGGKLLELNEATRVPLT